jgi:DNA-binding IclR family transcriptional regulator
VRDGFEVVHLEARAPQREIAIAKRTGRRAPMHCTALGKVLLAARPNASGENSTNRSSSAASAPAHRAQHRQPVKFFEHLRTCAVTATRSTSASSKKGSSARRRPCTQATAS